MNLSFKPGMSVFLDTTVLCGALRVPKGVNRKILKLARASVFFKPVLSKVCLLEFYRNAINGLGRGESKVCYTSNEILTFLNAFIYPILEDNPAVNSSVGRYSIETIIRENQPLDCGNTYNSESERLSALNLPPINSSSGGHICLHPIHPPLSLRFEAGVCSGHFDKSFSQFNRWMILQSPLSP